MKLKLNLMPVMRATALAGVAVALLASCGGGTQIESFVPERIVVFGDEASLIEPDPAFPGEGRKYTVNGIELDATGALTANRKCAINAIWVQQLAYNYGFAFPECATTGYAANGVMRAQAGSTVATMSTQIGNYMASPGFTPRDLVTVMVGTHDIVAAASAADPVAAARAAGVAVGEQVVRITNQGAKVIVSTVPDVGVTPQGRASQSELLSELTTQFNTQLRLKLQEVRGGGHSAGLVLGDELVLTMMKFPTAYGVVNLTHAACVTALPDCDQRPAYLSETPDARTTRAGDWLWAGPYQLGANAQSRLGTLAVNRARTNPF
jgi:phospholipase/lecithinase/hemolysin